MKKEMMQFLLENIRDELSSIVDDVDMERHHSRVIENILLNVNAALKDFDK